MPDVSKPKLSALSWHEVVHFRSAVDIRPFSPVFPLAGSIAKVFFRLFLWNFKEKTSTIFYGTAIFIFGIPRSGGFGKCQTFQSQSYWLCHGI